ncbi:hypothetical protein Q8A73_022874, partial [Channa argus]
SVYTRWRLQWNSFFQHVGIGGSVYVVLMDHQEKDSVYTRWRLQWNSFFQHVGIGAVEHNVGIGSSVVMRLVCGLVRSTDGPSKNILSTHSVYTRWRLQWNSFFQHVGIGGSYVVLMDHQEKDSVYTRWRLQWNSFFQHVGIGGSVVEFSPATRETRVGFPNSFLRHMGIGGSVVEFSPLHLQILTPLGWHETQKREKGSRRIPSASLAQLAARQSHNLKVVSSSLTRGRFFVEWTASTYVRSSTFQRQHCMLFPSASVVQW